MIKGEKVSIRRVTEDKYGRTVGELSFNGENLQQLLVKEGHAEIYKKYSKPCEWASQKTKYQEFDVNMRGRFFEEKLLLVETYFYMMNYAAEL